MDRIAVFTFTRDRLDFTRKCFTSMRETRPGYTYHHYVYDQGSTDGTGEYLTELLAENRIQGLIRWPSNQGLSFAFNAAFSDLASYDYIMSVDNDCLFKTKHWLKKLVRAYHAIDRGRACVISPRVMNLRHPPPAFATKRIDNFRFSFTDILGGISRFCPTGIIGDFRFNERLPMAWGQDQEFAAHCRDNGFPMAYVENITVRHMMTDEEQDDSIPDYMKRKGYELFKPRGL